MGLFIPSPSRLSPCHLPQRGRQFRFQIVGSLWAEPCPVSFHVASPGFPNGLPVIDHPRANSVQAGACRRGNEKRRGSVTGRVRAKTITDHPRANSVQAGACSSPGIVSAHRKLTSSKRNCLPPRGRWHGESRDGEGMKSPIICSALESAGQGFHRQPEIPD